MSITIDQIIQDAQRMANHAKDLEAIGNVLLIETESNNRQMETMKQFKDDIDSLNKLARDKSNADMVNRINQQNPSIREIRQENRELKASLEDHQRALELIMHKYREHTQHKILSSRVNFKELCNAKNEKMVEVIRKQAEKITEMAAVMQKAAKIDDDVVNKEIECITRLKVENQGLRELLQISAQYGSNDAKIEFEDKAIQTESDVKPMENGEDDEAEDSSPMALAGSVETMKKKTQPSTVPLVNGEENTTEAVPS